MARIAVAVSGGVDSSVALLLLHAAGHDVIGITMKHLPAELAGERVGSCCAPSAVAAAGRLAARLGVPHYVFDLEKDFAEAVMAPTAMTYAAGRTPNPCVLCNERVKFSALERRAAALGAEFYATGHYARIEDGKLFKAVDASRDQSYFLYRVAAAKRSRLMLPLGGLLKDEVRARAREAGLEMSDNPDSQDVCFAPDGDFSAAFQRFAPKALESGPVVDESGKVLGRHAGLGRLTVGQRRGLGIPMGSPVYVRTLDAVNRTAVVGPRPSAMSFDVIETVFDEDVAPAFSGQVRVRSQHQGAACRVERATSGARITLDEPLAGVTPGQSAVFYDGDRLLGGGIISFG